MDNSGQYWTGPVSPRRSSSRSAPAAASGPAAAGRATVSPATAAAAAEAIPLLAIEVRGLASASLGNIGSPAVGSGMDTRPILSPPSPGSSPAEKAFTPAQASIATMGDIDGQYTTLASMSQHQARAQARLDAVDAPVNSADR